MNTPQHTGNTPHAALECPHLQSLAQVPATPRHGLSPAVVNVLAFYENLTPASLDQLHTVYADNAYFKDPFSEVYNRQDIHAIYTRMYQQVDEPRFEVHTVLVQGDDVFLTWNFSFRMKRYQPKAQQCCKGSSHLRLAADGRIAYHRDYWDPCEELYEKIPVLRWLFKWLKKHE